MGLDNEIASLKNKNKASRSYIIDFMAGETKNIVSRPYSGTAAHDWFDEHIDKVSGDERYWFEELSFRSVMDILMLLDEGYTSEAVVALAKEREEVERRRERELTEKKKQEDEQIKVPAGVIFSSNAEVVPIGF